MAAGVLSSCSQKGTDAMELDDNMQRVTLKVDVQDESLTRATSTEPTRFLVEVYQGGLNDYDYTTPANIFAGNTTNKSEMAATSGTADFDLVLDRRLTYRFVLWADQGGAAVYNTDALKTGVSLKTDQNPVQAWYYGDKEARSGVYNTISVVLNRVVSKVNFKEIGSLKGKTDQNLVVKYNQPTTLTFVDGLPVAATPVQRAVTIPVTVDVTGTTQAPVTLNTDPIYILSSGATADLATFDFRLGTEADFKVSNAPMKANFVTNIIGHFTSIAAKGIIVKGEGEWETPDINMLVPKMGDYVYQDKTYSSTYIADAQNPIIGVVLSAGEANTVKIVNSAKKDGMWAGGMAAGYVAGATDQNDGQANYAAMKLSYGWTDQSSDFFIIEWVESLTTGGLDWYIPAILELQTFQEQRAVLMDRLDRADTEQGWGTLEAGKVYSSTYTGSEGNGGLSVMKMADGAISRENAVQGISYMAMAKVTLVGEK